MASVAQVKMIVATETPCTTQMPGAKPCALHEQQASGKGENNPRPQGLAVARTWFF